MTAAACVYEIRCAEIWGGASAREDAISTPGVHTAIHSSAAGSDRGGDLYYFSVCAYDTLTRVAIADVRGHGEDAGRISQWLYESLETRMNDDDGAAVLSDLNQIVRARGFEAITTAAIATFHRNRGAVYYCYAGHPPLFIGRQGQPWRELAAPAEAGPANLPLGIMPGARYVQTKAPAAAGDRLFAYTDGVAECPAPGAAEDPELYGDAKMLEALNRSLGQPLEDVCEGLREGLLRHAGGALTHDDCTFLLVEVREAPPFWKRRILPGKPHPR